MSDRLELERRERVREARRIKCPQCRAAALRGIAKEASTTAVRIVHDDRPIGQTLCLTWLDTRRGLPRLCFRPKGHPTGCLPAGPIPMPDISPSNPRWEA